MLALTWPNRITIVRILLIGPFVIALLKLQEPGWTNAARWSAIAVFFLMALSDGLDGFLARRWHQESLAGRFLDPLADKLLVLFSFVLLAHHGTHVEGARLPATIVVVAIGKDLIVVLGFCIIYFSTSKVFIKPGPAGKCCTTVQLAMVIAVLLSPDLPDGLRYYLPRSLWWAATVLAVLTVVSYFQTGRRFLARHEAQSQGG